MERRVPGFASVDPWCRQFEIHDDGSVQPVTDSSGREVRVTIKEQDEESQTEYTGSSSSSSDHMSDCGCLWWLTWGNLEPRKVSSSLMMERNILFVHDFYTRQHISGVRGAILYVFFFVLEGVWTVESSVISLVIYTAIRALEFLTCSLDARQIVRHPSLLRK